MAKISCTFANKKDHVKSNINAWSVCELLNKIREKYRGMAVTKYGA
jgi:hypothetical protein